MKTEHSYNDTHPKKPIGNEDRFSREIFAKYNELFKVGELITSEMDYEGCLSHLFFTGDPLSELS